jgi:hypothetical protein
VASSPAANAADIASNRRRKGMVSPGGCVLPGWTVDRVSSAVLQRRIALSDSTQRWR